MTSKKPAETHPTHKAQISRLRRVKGQIEGIEKMIVDRRYCPEIITQIRAARAALKSLEANVLETHFQHCVQDVMTSKDAAAKQKKINEILLLFKDS